MGVGQLTGSCEKGIRIKCTWTCSV
jgi:hypothetical protein